MQRVDPDELQKSITGVAAFEFASDGDLSWVSAKKLGNWPEVKLRDFDGTALVAPMECAKYASWLPYTLIPADDPRVAFADLARLLVEPKPPKLRIHPTAVIDSTVVIGNDGFGLYRCPTVRYLRQFPHYGGVLIDEHVKVGAHTCIDRGALGDTVIGAGTCIDNLVHIAHGATIGRNCQIVAHALICGSVDIGDEVFIGGGAMIKNGVSIGDGAVIGLGAVVINDVPSGVTVVGNPAKPI